MKKLCLICFLYLIVIFFGCGKNDITQEIKIKKSDTRDNKENKIDANKDETNKQSLVESNSLQTITSKEVKLHVGDSLIIQGFIADVYLSDKVAYLNFEYKFPKNLFAAAIFPRSFNEFGDLSKYRNKKVEVVGKIATYKNKPQVILTSKDQIKIRD